MFLFAVAILLVLLASCISFHDINLLKWKYSDRSIHFIGRNKVYFAPKVYQTMSDARATIKLHNHPNNDHGPPRLSNDIANLIEWIETKNSGQFHACIQPMPDGWVLLAKQRTIAGDILLKIPKKTCLFSDTSVKYQSISNNAKILMESLDKKQWRARLALAVLSERVRPDSFYKPFIANLPFEHWSHSVFFKKEEFALVQELSFQHRAQQRYEFLQDLVVSILWLRSTHLDPFYGESVDINSLGWAFAISSSRAIRSSSIKFYSDQNAVLIPGIDIASHSFTPNCEVVDYDDSFCLVALRDINESEELTISYGSLGNDELFEDFGFTVDNNPYDNARVNCDYHMLNLARLVMGQSRVITDGGYVGDEIQRESFDLPSLHDLVRCSHGSDTRNTAAQGMSFDTPTKSTSFSRMNMIGRGGTKYDEKWLQPWQSEWLSVLNLVGPGGYAGMKLGCSTMTSTESKLWAFLRIIYATNEDEITRHGYDPFSLMHSSALTSVETEKHVIRTVVGIVGIILRVFGTDLDSDIKTLLSGTINNDLEQKAHSGYYSATSDDIVADVRKILRKCYGIPEPLPPSPTIRRARALSMARSPQVQGPGTNSTATFPLVINSFLNCIRINSLLTMIYLQGVSVEAMLRERENRLKSQLPQGEVNTNDGFERLVPSFSSDVSENILSDGNPQNLFPDNSNPLIPPVDIDLNGLGMELPFSDREILKYRIRKKRGLRNLLFSLAERYLVIITLSSML